MIYTRTALTEVKPNWFYQAADPEVYIFFLLGTHSTEMKNFTEVSTQRCHTASAFFAVLGNSLMCPMPTSQYREKSGQES